MKHDQHKGSTRASRHMKQAEQLDAVTMAEGWREKHPIEVLEMYQQMMRRDRRFLTTRSGDRISFEWVRS